MEKMKDRKQDGAAERGKRTRRRIWTFLEKERDSHREEKKGTGSRTEMEKEKIARDREQKKRDTEGQKDHYR